MHGLFDADAAQRQQAPDDFGQVEPLGDAEAEMRRGFGGACPPQPASAGEAPLYAEDGVGRLRLRPGRGEGGQRITLATNA
jgi:hypothetical protein